MAALVALLVGGCTLLPSRQPATSTPPPRSGGEITIALVVPNPGNLDPARAERPGERILAANLFDGLTTLDRDGRARPAAAESWSADPEQRTWTFRLRQGATFGDGAPVTAASFVTAWERAARSPRAGVRALLARVDGASAFAGREADRISGLAAPDDATLTVTLTEPFADFPALAAEPALAPVPAQAVSDPAAFAARPLGNGPFLLAEPAGDAPGSASGGAGDGDDADSDADSTGDTGTGDTGTDADTDTGSGTGGESTQPGATGTGGTDAEATEPDSTGTEGEGPDGTAGTGTGNTQTESAGPGGGAGAQGKGAPVRSLVLTRNPAAQGATAYLDRVRVLAVPDEQTAWLAFQEGEVAFAPVPLDQLDAARAVYQGSPAGPAGTSGSPGAGTGVTPGSGAPQGAGGASGGAGGLVSSPEAIADVLGFDRASAPFSDRAARLGVALAVDRRRLASRFSGARVPADALVPDGVATTPGAACPACGHDPARARQLFGEAGVTTIDLTVPSGPAGRTFADQIGTDLEAAGVSVKIHNAGASSLNRPRSRGVTVVTLQPPPGAASAGPFLTAFYGARGTALKPGRLDPALADLLEQAVTSPDEPTRARSARQAQDQLEAEAISAPLLEHRHHAAVAPGVLGLDLTPSGLIDLAAASLANPPATESRR